MDTSRAKIIVQGVVQGVGFRPFIYQIAQEKGLKGYVSNTPFGVDIEVEGDISVIKDFLKDIELKKPPLSEIVRIETHMLSPVSYKDFSIKVSSGDSDRSVIIPPDACICEECVKELFDPSDRRYRYPFINCTNCGPRYTIIKDIPYDRDKTTMQPFKMCEACEKEYVAPANRRFHAQPNACWECGPRVSLYDKYRNLIKTDDPVKEAVQMIKKGKILALQGLGGFHVAVDALNSDAVMTLRLRKNREAKPFAMMARDLESISKFSYINDDEKTLIASVRRPIVLLKKKEGNPIACEVAPGNNEFGVMLPYTPLHYLLFDEDFTALVMTSGNISEEPMVISPAEAFKKLAGMADYILVHDREIYCRNDDSVLRVVRGRQRQIRRSRGYVPIPITLPWSMKHVLAFGADLKNTVCLTKGNQAFLSQHIGDLESWESFQFLEQTVQHIQKVTGIKPEVIACDMHPEYHSTKYALSQQGIKCIKVQHHHAHIVSCMAENGIEDTVIGLSFDGTGYGTDATIWGGEVLISDADHFERVAHLDYLPIPGSNAAIKEPWRMGVSYLVYAYSTDFMKLHVDFLKSLEPAKLQTVLHMIQKGINSPLTSSMGRLFDGISALLLIKGNVSYEGEAAIELEACIDKNEKALYPYEIRKEGAMRIIGYKGIIEGVVHDLEKSLAPSVISAKFHNTLVEIFTQVCINIRDEKGINKIAMSGGVFQNVFLLENMFQRLYDSGFEVYAHSKVPCNDGGISLGQAVIANFSIERRKN